MEKTEWPVKLTSKLIDEYEKHPCLFDTTHKFYANKHARKDAVFQMCEQLKVDNPNLTVEDVKRKVTNLRSQFTHERTKVNTSRHSGAGADEVYEPKAWWYEKLNFLMPHIRARKGKSSLELKSQDDVHNQEMLSQEPDTDSDGEKQAPTQPGVAGRYHLSDSGSENENRDPVETPSTSSSSATLKRKRKELKYAKLDDPNTDNLITATMETLTNLTHHNNNKLPRKGRLAEAHQVFGEFVASELSKIDNVEIVNDAKFEINTILYNANKKFIEATKAGIQIDVD